MNGPGPIINPCIDALVTAALTGKYESELTFLCLLTVGRTSIVPRMLRHDQPDDTQIDFFTVHLPVKIIQLL